MKSYTKLQCFFIVFLLGFVNSGYNAEILRLYEGDICQKGDEITANAICRNIESCPVILKEIKRFIRHQICSFNGSIPIVCCPPEKNTLVPITTTMITPKRKLFSKTYSADKMCSEYSKLIDLKKNNSIPMLDKNDQMDSDWYDAVKLITNSTAAEPNEFPHMALLGYGEKPYISWECGGSLISNRFVLTAAHCEKIENKFKPRFANWARLGEPVYFSKTDDNRPRPGEYKIVERIIHPNYKSNSLYNDIALFRLERDVDFSQFVRPICLNTNNMLDPPVVIATGWGRTDKAPFLSSHFLKEKINIISAKDCNKRFSYMVNTDKKLIHGIVDNSMICAGNPEGGSDTFYTCEPGGPIQIKHNSYKYMYSQIGVASFGGQFCGKNGLPTVYTRVSNYISWIEKIVWPIMK